MAKLEDVFGVSTHQVLSYITRPEVDDKFTAALVGDKQIVVYGASKQGKTALVSKYLPYDQHLPVSVTPKTEIVDIYSSVLRQLNVKLVSSQTDSSGRETQASVGLKVKALIPLFGGGEGSATAGAKSEVTKTSQFEEVPFNLALPQDVSELLKKIGSQKIIIIENFHYLDEDKQKQLAFDLRTFQELGVRFVILGVWREKNRLAQYNGDLLDRVVEIPVEPWTESEFQKVADAGSSELKVHFNDGVIAKCIQASFSSIGVFQELLKSICVFAGVRDTQFAWRDIGDDRMLTQAVETKAQEYAARHQRALESIAAGNLSATTKDGVTPLFLPYYLVRVVLSAGYDGIESGMRRAAIQEQIQKIHHRAQDVRASDMSNLLHTLGSLQSKKNISPPIIDYDKNMKLLQAVDSTFYFFLKHADLKQIAEELPSPLD
ncbi:hypothetical protein [Oligosphaera ethanolica]|uniref:Uncharacterized protein n=1 Tax=Oligosphaera ethanolica TaxID=760260 RepID=A0AAE4AQU3_9BACT|nr:hypothetical protein [Oligosphaera ethanolica]MDQ0291895.1 hypothetical protein [Oligosphaera ethanolica]